MKYYYEPWVGSTPGKWFGVVFHISNVDGECVIDYKCAMERNNINLANNDAINWCNDNGFEVEAW